MDHYLMLSVRTAIRAFDPEISMVGLELDEFYSRGKVTYEVTQPNPSGSGDVTSKVTKLLPMRFSQAVQIYDQSTDRTPAASNQASERTDRELISNFVSFLFSLLQACSYGRCHEDHTPKD
jgi:hypothetical protein